MKYLVSLFAVLLLISPAPAQCHYSRCYTPTYNYTPAYQAPYYPPQQSYYYHKEYVPYVIEVNVNKDRYYSLSELYRDQLYLQMFDTLRRMNSGDNGSNVNPPASNKPNGYNASTPADPLPTPKPQVKKGFWGRSTDAAVKVVNDNCIKCHGKGSETLDLSDLDAVPPLARAAAFALASTGDMPPPPKELRVAGKEKELAAWKKENALKDEILEPLYLGWVDVGRKAVAISRK